MITRTLIATLLVAIVAAQQPLIRGGASDSDNQDDKAVVFLDPKTVSHKFETNQETFTTADQQPPKSRRKFVSYTSSYLERLWLKYVDKWASEQQICDVLLDQQSTLIHDLLNLTCTQRYRSPYQWCVIDDGQHQLWYNAGNRDDFE